MVIGEVRMAGDANPVADKPGPDQGRVIESDPITGTLHPALEKAFIQTRTDAMTRTLNTTASLISALALMAIAAPALAQAPVTTPASDGPVTIILTLETGAQTGTVQIALFDSEAAYGGGAPMAATLVDIGAGQHTATFSNLPAGTYAARMFHDVDGNGTMNTNPFGIPTEPYAFSNNARGNMGPASWERAHFVADGAVTQTITVK